MRSKWILLLGLLSVASWGCTTSVVQSQHSDKVNSKIPKATPTPHSGPTAFSKDLKELRARFNRDAGKVRLVTLLSPT